MIKESITIQDVLDILNSAVDADSEAMERLTEARVPCNDAMAKHSTIQVGLGGINQGKYRVGVLGILNGLFGVNEEGYGAIAASFEVNCPNGCDNGYNSLVVGDKCPKCDSKLVLGKLIEFVDLGKR